MFEHQRKLGAPQHDALGTALYHRVDGVGNKLFGGGDDPIKGEFLLDDPMKFFDGGFFQRHKNLDAVAANSVCDESFFHRKLGTDEANRFQSLLLNRVFGGVRNVDNRNVNGLANDVIAFVRCVGTQHDRLCTSGFQSLCAVDDQVRDALPVVFDLQTVDVGLV